MSNNSNTNAKLSINTVFYLEGELSLGKCALSLAMVKDEYDDLLVDILKEKDIKAVITRAGGRGDNFKSKILRNTITAAFKSGLLTENKRNAYAISRCCEEAMSIISRILNPISGAGIKIGIVVKDDDIAIGIFGKEGIPGMEIDREISGMACHSHVIEN